MWHVAIVEWFQSCDRCSFRCRQKLHENSCDNISPINPKISCILKIFTFSCLMKINNARPRPWVTILRLPQKACLMWNSFWGHETSHIKSLHHFILKLQKPGLPENKNRVKCLLKLLDFHLQCPTLNFLNSISTVNPQFTMSRLLFLQSVMGGYRSW